MNDSERIDKIEKRQDELEEKLNTTLSEMKSDLAIIKERTNHINEDSDLKNEVLKKDIDNNNKRIEKLENNQQKLVWAVIGEFLALIFAVIKAVFQSGIIK